MASEEGRFIFLKLVERQELMGTQECRSIRVGKRCWYLAHAWVPFRRAFVAPSPTCELPGGSGGAGVWWGEGRKYTKASAGQESGESGRAAIGRRAADAR
ncbi:unnamed protein product [Rangifer tarandus platyrhynchus]|uniref:Uncharacterized protein n=1 Tax=Rangifer tarandus platyrhynchus TaxID=3082113 RepID=A0ABN8Y322_RANTA|nr:unnamed protein product [Rangifer tarandus platyrhynchus]